LPLDNLTLPSTLEIKMEKISSQLLIEKQNMNSGVFWEFRTAFQLLVYRLNNFSFAKHLKID
jgi:hypothetical protein